MPKLSVLAPEVAGGTRSSEVASRVKEAVFLGILNPGQQLPNEVDLARQFGVSPMTVREALAQLREMGLVETRRGRAGGSFVRHQASLPVTETRARLADLTISQFRDLLDENEAIGGHAAELAARRSSDTNDERLAELADVLAEATTPGDRARADSRFHIELAVAAQSDRLTRAEVRLQAELSGLLWLPLGDELDLELVVAQHRGIAQAVTDGDSDRARVLAQAHVRLALPRLVSAHLAATEGC